MDGLREGADLAQMADMEALVAPVEHDDPSVFFSSEAVGRALGRRRFDWRGVRTGHDQHNNIEPDHACG